MDHDEVREQLELAAVEPGGLERLVAGDTATASAVAAHLAGCEACSAELQRLERSVPLLRDTVRTTPPADLRERTLAFVAARGIPRGATEAGSAAVASAVAAGAGDGPSIVTPFPVRPAEVPAEPTATEATARSARSLLPWIATIAAAVVLSVGVTTAVVGNRVDSQIAALDQQVEGLSDVTLATMSITAEPDVARVALASTTGTPAEGSIVFSPGTTQLVVVATGLTPPPSDMEYRCWVVIDGTRQNIGKMFFADDLAYWVGDTPAIADLPAGTQFGVSVADVGGPAPNTDPVIVGQL